MVQNLKFAARTTPKAVGHSKCICSRPHRIVRAPLRVSAIAAPVSDATVPEGHKSLHNALYSQDDEHMADMYSVRQDQDDGSTLVSLPDWLAVRDGEKPLGVYAIYDEAGALQYIGYSRNMVTAVRAHAARVGSQRAAQVRAMVFGNKAMATRDTLERQVTSWVQQYSPGGALPPGNSTDKDEWEGAPKVLSEVEAAEHAAKATKLKLAMGEGRGETVEDVRTPEAIRADLRQAVEGGNWSEVIDRQTQEAVGVKAEASAAPSGSAQGGAPSSGAPTGGSGPMVSPFAQPTVHRKIGGSGAGGSSGGNGGESEGNGGGDDRPMTVESVDLVLNEVRPYLVADGGDVEVVDVDSGRVFLRLQGSCSTCASSSATMKMGIERALQAAFGEQLKEVIQVDKTDVVSASVDNINLHLGMLRGAVASFGGAVEAVSVEGGKATIKYKGPPAIGKGVSAAIRDQFPEIREVVLLDF